mgnify:CR=1 FL=1
MASQLLLTLEKDTAVIGKLTQDETIDATIHVPSMLSKHFAVVGSTGVGKSTAVSLLLRKAIESDPKLRILILDPHNEFAAAFPELAVVIDTDTLDLRGHVLGAAYVLPGDIRLAGIYGRSEADTSATARTRLRTLGLGTTVLLIAFLDEWVLELRGKRARHADAETHHE